MSPTATPVSRQPTIRFWQDPEAISTTLVVLLNDAYGTEAFGWSPETIQMELHQEGIKLPDANLSRLMAGIHLVTTDEFYHSLPAFNELCYILAGHPHHPGIFEVADSEACAWGLTEALLVSPPDEKNQEPFSDDIRHYLAALLHHEGIITPPDVLKLALTNPKYADQVKMDYSDDPEMFNAIWDAENEKTQSINSFVRQRMSTLLNTLQQLPLQNGDAKQIVDKLLAGMSQRQ